MSHIINNLDSNASNWQTLGQIKAADKIEISGATLSKGAGKVSISEAGAFQSVFRSFNKAINSSIADAKSTTEWLGHFQGKNLSDLEALHSHVEHCTDQAELESILNSLFRMKNAISSSNEGFQHLAETYGKERVFHSNISMEEALNQKKEINTLILEQVDQEIAHIKNKFIEEILTNSAGQPDTTNTADSAVKQIKEYVVGNLLKESSNENQKDAIIKDKEGNEIKLPMQFSLDLGRTPLVQLNGEVIYSNQERDKYDIVSAYKSLQKALGSSDSALRGIMNLTTQGMFADTLEHTMFKNINNPKDVRANTTSFPFQYLVKVEGDKVSLTLNNGYNIKPLMMEDAPLEGYRLIKREFELSLKELQGLGNDKEKSVETVTAKDTYSTLIKDINAATALYKVF